VKILVTMLPPIELSPNSRCHWAEKYQAAEVFQRAVYYSAVDAINRCLPLKRPRNKAKLNLTFVYPQRRQRDRDNLVAMFKPGLDALVKAGLLVGDDTEHLDIAGVSVKVNKERAPLTIVELEEVTDGARKGKSHRRGD